MVVNKRKTFKLNEHLEVIVSGAGRMTFYCHDDQCIMQLQSSDIMKLKKALDDALVRLNDYFEEVEKNG